MELKNLLFEENEGIGIITINRPEKLNALNKKVLSELKMSSKEFDPMRK